MLYKVCLMLHVMCRIYVYNADLYINAKNLSCYLQLLWNSLLDNLDNTNSDLFGCTMIRPLNGVVGRFSNWQCR
jgi:hypothetical protein